MKLKILLLNFLLLSSGRSIAQSPETDLVEDVGPTPVEVPPEVARKPRAGLRTDVGLIVPSRAERFLQVIAALGVPLGSDGDNGRGRALRKFTRDVLMADAVYLGTVDSKTETSRPGDFGDLLGVTKIKVTVDGTLKADSQEIIDEVDIWYAGTTELPRGSHTPSVVEGQAYIFLLIRDSAGMLYLSARERHLATHQGSLSVRGGAIPLDLLTSAFAQGPGQ